MPRKTLIGMGLGMAVLVLIILLLRRNDGFTPVQRDIAKSLERAKVLKAKRDSVAKLEGQKRFGKEEEIEEVEKAGQVGEAGKTGNTGEAGELAKPDAPQSNEEENRAAPEAQAPKPVAAESTSQEGNASVPDKRFFTTSGMDGLTPLEKQTDFNVGDPVYIYAGIHAPQAEQVRLEWIDPSGDILPPAELIQIQINTGTNGYRIYKQRKFQVKGKYAVQLYNGAGELIGKTRFRVVDR